MPALARRGGLPRRDPGRAPTASASATSCRCRCRSTCSARRRRSRSRSSCSGCSCAARRPARRAADVDLLATRSGGCIGHPAVVSGAQARRARPVHRHRAGRPVRRPEPLPQHRADPGVDHLVGGARLRCGLRRRSLGARSIPGAPLFDGADRLYRRLGGRRRAVAAPALSAKRWASGRRACCCSPSPGSSSSIRTPPSPAHIAWPGDRLFRSSPGPACWRSAATPGCGTARCSRWCSAHSPASRRPRRRDGAAAAAPIRRRPARRPARLDVDDGLRAAAAGDRALRRADRHRRMGDARRRAARRCLPASGESAPWCSRRVGLAASSGCCSSAPISASARVMSALAAGRPGPLEMARSFALTLVPIAIGYHVAHYLVFLLVQGQYIIPLLSDPFGFGWNLLRHGRLSRRHRPRRRALCLVRGRRRHRRRPRRRRLSRPRRGDRRCSSAARAALRHAGAADGADGGLHVHRPVHHRRADRREPRPPHRPPWRARPSRSRRCRAARAPERPACSPSGPDKTAQAEAHLQGARLGLPRRRPRRRVADLLYAYAFAYRWGVARRRRAARYDPFIDAATASLRRHLVARAPRRRRRRLQVLPRRRRQFRARGLHRRGLPRRSRRTIRNGTRVVAPPWSTLPWHVLVLMEEAVTRGWAAFSRSRGGAARRAVARSRPLEAR